MIELLRTIDELLQFRDDDILDSIKTGLQEVGDRVTQSARIERRFVERYKWVECSSHFHIQDFGAGEVKILSGSRAILDSLNRTGVHLHSHVANRGFVPSEGLRLGDMEVTMFVNVRENGEPYALTASGAAAFAAGGAGAAVFFASLLFCFW